MYRKVVLIVDDEPDMLNLLETLIKNGGYVPLKATNAHVALNLIQSLMPDLIVLDDMVSGVNGFELCREIREIPYMADRPIIIFTKYNLAQDSTQAAEVGANAIVTKPDAVFNLISTIKKFLNGAPPEPKH